MKPVSSLLYKRLFKASPGKILVLQPGNFRIITATEEYLRATMTHEDDIVGKTIFEVFPDDPEDTQADGVRSLSESLQRVQSQKVPDNMGVQRYPIRLPDGKFEDRFWSPVNTPVLDEDGDIEFIMHRAEDITAIVQGSTEGAVLQAIDNDNSVAVQDVIMQARDLRRALSKQQEHEARMRTAERMLTLGAWELDVHSGQLSWSEQTFDIYDVSDKQATPDLEEYLAMVHPEDRPATRDIYKEFIQHSKSHIDFEHRLIRQDGGVKYIRGVGERHVSTDGEIVVGYVQDITPLLMARRRLTQAEQMLRLAGEMAEFGAWRIELASETITWTPETAAIHGMPPSYSPPNVSAAVQFYAPEYRDLVKAAFDKCVHLGKEFDVSCQLQTPDGRRPWIRAIGVAERDSQGTVVAVQGAFQDITSLYEAQAELQQAQERFQLLSRATNDVIWDWNLVTDEIWWNDAMTTVFGYELSELQPDSDSWVKRIHPEDSELVVKSVHDVIKSDKELWQCEYRFIRRDGRSAHIIDRGFVIRDNAGTAIRMVGSMLDITERMDMEKRMRESQRLEAVGQLTGSVAHDFNNLLTVILGNSEMLTELVVDPKLRPLVEITMSAAQRGAELTNRLLAFSRRQPLDPKPTDLNQLVDAIHGLIRRALPENIELEIVPDPELGVAELDADELDTALLNLVVNARDAVTGGGKVTVETANALLDHDYADQHSEVTPGEYVMICVSDTGTGMDPKTIDQAFEPFFTTKGPNKGSGLGLSMVFGFVKQSGGHIKIYSEPGEGTAVKLYFPRVRGSQPSSYQPIAKLTVHGGTEHILIAEDDDQVLEHLEGQLHSLGYRVTVTRSGPEALNALSSHRDIDLLLTDVIMPGGLNGRQLSDRARAIYPSLKVLYTSGYTENAIVHHGRLDPGVDLLSKPYTRSELATKVRQVLDKR